MDRIDDQEVMIPARQAADIAGISPQRLWYWEKTELIRPTVAERLSKRNYVRLYSLDRLLELVAAASLVEKPGISLQHVRRLLDYLRESGGYEAPLRELRFAVDGDEIYFQHVDGNWEGSLRPMQLVAHQVLNLEAIRERISSKLRRPKAAIGRTEKRRAVHGSKPVVAGTRVPVSAVLSFIAGGRTDGEIVEALPELELGDVRAIRSGQAEAS